jgi:hypothetical protein
METDPTKKAYLTKEYNKWVGMLRSQLQSIVKLNTTQQKDSSLPGYWEELRERFQGQDLPKEPFMSSLEPVWEQIRQASAGIGPSPDENTSVDELLKQAQKALEIMTKALQEYEKILDDETYNAWRDHG